MSDISEWVRVDADGVGRCWWPGDNADYIHYHDHEWGRPVVADFDFAKVASFDETDVARLLGDAGIIRHRGKIEAAINNAQRCCELVDEAGSLAAYIWQYEPR